MLAAAQDGKRVKGILEGLEITDDAKAEIKGYLLEVYRNLNKKKQKNFFKEAQLGRLIGKDFEDNMKREVQ